MRNIFLFATFFGFISSSALATDYSPCEKTIQALAKAYSGIDLKLAPWNKQGSNKMQNPVFKNFNLKTNPRGFGPEDLGNQGAAVVQIGNNSLGIDVKKLFSKEWKNTLDGDDNFFRMISGKCYPNKTNILPDTCSPYTVLTAHMEITKDGYCFVDRATVAYDETPKSTEVLFTQEICDNLLKGNKVTANMLVKEEVKTDPEGGPSKVTAFGKDHKTQMGKIMAGSGKVTTEKKMVGDPDLGDSFVTRQKLDGPYSHMKGYVGKNNPTEEKVKTFEAENTAVEKEAKSLKYRCETFYKPQFEREKKAATGTSSSPPSSNSGTTK